jgi:signal transduction histidine kinase
LRAMRSFSQLLSLRLADRVAPEEADYLKRIITAAERLDHLIQDVLSYSRLARGQIKLETVDVESLVNEIMREHPSLEPSKSLITIESRLLTVLGHQASLSQVISNLLTNAVKFVPAGTFPKVRIWSELLDSQVRLWIEDNGIGIPKADHERIFGMFQRLHTQQEFEGTGIGLAIVRKAVERMGGRVGVESEPGKGSKFWVQLPRGTSSP